MGFDYYGVHSRFFRKDGKFSVETDGPDGKLATFEVKYTFGVDPLAYAERLARIAPDDPDVGALIESLRRQRPSPAPTR